MDDYPDGTMVPGYNEPVQRGLALAGNREGQAPLLRGSWCLVHTAVVLCCFCCVCSCLCSWRGRFVPHWTGCVMAEKTNIADHSKTIACLRPPTAAEKKQRLHWKDSVKDWKRLGTKKQWRVRDRAPMGLADSSPADMQGLFGDQLRVSDEC